jgi:signal transduction histidine kinase
MLPFPQSLFDTSDFPPRWHCGRWTELHGWVHIASDLAIFAAYLSIPIALLYFLWRRPDVPFPRILILFGVFILSCGVGHLLEAVIFWHPVYRLAGAIKVVTAIVSWTTVFALVRIAPRALALPGLVRTVDELQLEMKESKRADALTQAHARNLEHLNRELSEAKSALEHGMEELSRSNRELDEFAYAASHDLKEPLRGIHNIASIVLEDHVATLDDEGRRMLQTLPRLTNRLGLLIDALLHSAQVGRIDLDRAETDLALVVDEVLDALQMTLKEHKVEVRVPRRLSSARCNKSLVGEVFHNLILNAVKYNDKDAPWIEIGYEQSLDSTEPVFYVRDNGIGIEEKFHESVFRIFRRLHSRDAYGGGSGAGLTIAKKIVERHGGRIWLESRPEVGSTFHFTLAEARP